MKEQTTMVIDGEQILPGESKQIKMVVGRLPSDTQITILTHVFRAEEPGPTVLFLGGVHGDEINGIETIRKSIEIGTFEHLKKGTVIAIPLLNVFGFINFSRDVPDGKDVNRSFPGSSRGSLAARVAHTLTKKILPHVDYAVDLHTGGASRFNFPQIRYSATIPGTLDMAKAFGAPFTIEKATIPNSFRRVCKDNKIPAIVFEGGESIRINGFAISSAMYGLENILHYLEMLEIAPNKLHHKRQHIRKSTWIRASFSGLFIWTKSSGQEVVKGEPIGFIKDPFANKSVKVLSSRNGFILGHNNASVVIQGDALFNIGYNAHELD